MSWQLSDSYTRILSLVAPQAEVDNARALCKMHLHLCVLIINSNTWIYISSVQCMPSGQTHPVPRFNSINSLLSLWNSQQFFNQSALLTRYGSSSDSSGRFFNIGSNIQPHSSCTRILLTAWYAHRYWVLKITLIGDPFPDTLINLSMSAFLSISSC